jgi:hypothetical protein
MMLLESAGKAIKKLAAPSGQPVILAGVTKGLA